MGQRKVWAAVAVVLCAVTAVLAVAALTVLPPRAGTGEEAEDPVTIELVYAFQNSQWNAQVEEVIRRFEAEHPNIRISYEIRYEDAVYEDMLDKLAARDELGDVVQLKEPYSYARSGLIVPLPEELAGQCAFRCEVNGQTYAVAALGSTTGVVYNKTLFRQYGLTPPEHYQEFLALCQALQDQGVTPLGVGGKDLWHLEYWMNHFFRADVLAEEPEFLSQCRAGTRTWNDPLAGQMLEHLSQLFRQGFVSLNWHSTPDGALAYHMAEGEVAMVFSGPWLAADALELAPELELGWFYVPNEEGLTVAGDSVDVFWAITDGCARDAERYEAAVTFLDYFYSQAVYEDLCAAMAGYSTLADSSRGKYPLDGVTAELVKAHDDADMNLSAYIGNEDTPRGFEKKLLSLLSQLCAGSCTVEEAQAAIQTCWEQCVEQEAAYG